MQRPVRIIVPIAALSALVLVTSGCSGPGAAEPAPSLSSPAAEAEPTPELTEPPYDTELNLTADEKEAADGAYGILVRYLEANNAVTADSGRDPERVLQFTSGELHKDHAESFESMAEAGEVAVGAATHRYRHLDELEQQAAGEGMAVFESCLDFSHFDLLDKEGKSLSGGDTDPSIVHYSLDGWDSDWSLTDIVFTDQSCDE